MRSYERVKSVDWRPTVLHHYRKSMNFSISPPQWTLWSLISPVDVSAPLATTLTKEPLYIHTFQKVIPSNWALSIVELLLWIDGIHPWYHLDRTRYIPPNPTPFMCQNISPQVPVHTHIIYLYYLLSGRFPHYTPPPPDPLPCFLMFGLKQNTHNCSLNGRVTETHCSLSYLFTKSSLD